MEEKNCHNYYLGIDMGASKVRWGLFTKEGKCVDQTISNKEEKRGRGILATLTSWGRYKFLIEEEKRGESPLLINCTSKNLAGRIGIISIKKNQSEEIIKVLSEIIVFAKAIELSKHHYKIAAIGLAAPGPLDPLKGIIENPPNMAVNNLPIVGILEEKFEIPVFLLNDADAASLGEFWQGAAKGFQNIVMLMLGSGVGSGIVVNGKLARGRGKGGEWGHTSISRGLKRKNSRRCSCGHYDCLESYIGTNGLVQTYCEVFKKKKVNNPAEVAFWLIKGLKSKDPRWKTLLEIYASDLAEGVRNIICVHHPEIIILGGGISKLGQLLLKAFKKKLLSYNDKMMSSLDGVEIKLAKLEFPGVVGAAKYAIDEFESGKEDV